MSAVDKEFQFPTELLAQPQVLIGIVGLDTLNNAVHRATWDAFQNVRRPDGSSARFKLLSTSHEYPRPKSKKSYEQHIPKGILKRNWMYKHLMQVPAVVVIFYDLDWDDPQWDEKQQECVSRVQSIRLALDGHTTWICLVLIQQKAPNPTMDDIIASKRVDSLSQATELNKSSLFILPHTECFLGYISNLEKSFYDLCLNHYQNEILLIQAHKESLNKKIHQYLYVRHHFKMGFFSELRQDLLIAKKYYSEAYNSLLEVRLSDTNEFEVKTVAGFIAYKVSRVEFSIKWEDAKSHFRAHIDHYKHKTGHNLLLFHHHAWLSKQYSMFADLFDEMVHLGIPSTQIDHPGVYYRLAAQHAKLRKEWTQKLCANVQRYPDPDPLAGWESLEFYGQRPWRPCKLSAEPLDPELERQGILALQYNEKNVDHSGIINGLLGFAISQFKNYNCPKMKQHLVILMAEEYHFSKDYGKALTLLMLTFWDYRRAKWFLIANNLMVIALASAYLTASITDYVTLCLDVISRPTEENNEPIRALHNLIAIINGGVPEPEPGLTIEEIAAASELWKNASEKEFILIDTSVCSSPIQCKAVICKHEYNSLVINIFLRSVIPEPFLFSKLTLTTAVLGDGGATKPIEHVVETQISFVYGEVKTFNCSFVPNLWEIGKVVQISSIILTIGEIEGRTIGLKFNGYGTDSISIQPELLFFKQVKGPGGDFLKLKPRLNCNISRREAKVFLKVKHNPPALLDEWYPLRLLIDNKETFPVTKANVVLTFPPNFDPDIIHRSSFQEAGNKLIPLPITVELGDLDAFTEKCFYIKCASLDTRVLDIKLNYNVEGHLCIVEFQIVFDVKEPFTVNAKYMSTKFEELTELYTRGPFLIQPQISSTSPWPITIHSTTICLSDKVQVEGEYECLLKGCELDFQNTASELTCVSAKSFSDEPIHIASFTVVWARSGETETTSINYDLPEMKIVDIPISIIVNAPATGVVKRQYTAKYFITNHSSKLHVVELNVETSNEFRFAGIKKMQLFLQPESTKELEYQMYPLCCGTASLPNLTLVSLGSKEVRDLPNLAQVVQRALPANIFIMPDYKQSEGSNRQDFKTGIKEININDAEIGKT